MQGELNHQQRLQNVDREWGWRLLHPLIKEGHFARWSHDDAATLHKEDSCPLKLKLFISHRWEDPTDPDPNREQFRSLMEYISRVFMVANGIIDDRSHIVQELVLGEGVRNGLSEERLLECGCGTDSYANVRPILGDHDLFFVKVPIYRRRQFYRLLKHIYVWYDYSCLPQPPRNPDEMRVFETGLFCLPDIVKESMVTVLWGPESLNRAWCLFEAMAARTLHFCSPSSREHGSELDEFIRQETIRRLARESGKDEETAWYRGRNSQSILITIKHSKAMLAQSSQQEILQYFRSAGIDCTNRDDLPIVANLVYRSLRE